MATLWQVSDQSTVKFMERFYQEYLIPGTSRAIALHRAQQALFNEPTYQAPYYWLPTCLYVIGVNRVREPIFLR